MKRIKNQISGIRYHFSSRVTCYLILVTCYLCSCTSIIQVTVPNGVQEVVVDAFLDNSSNPQTVRLTFNASYFSNVPTPPVLGATVSLTDLTNTKTYSFTPDGNGNYIYNPVINDSMAQLNHKYQLNIAYNRNTYNALSTLNRTAKIDTILFSSSGRNLKDTVSNGDTSSTRRYYPYVKARDPRGHIPDYYWLKIYNNGTFYNQPGQLNAFQDAGYNGTDGYPFLPPKAFEGLTSGENPIHRYDVCTAEIYSIDNNTFNFLNQLKTQLTNSQNGLFAVTPQNVKTNIQQSSGSLPAIGWFNMGAISIKSVIAR
jgi:hypothetical protein